MASSSAARVRLDTLDLASLALFAGLRANELVLERIHAAGFAGLRTAHGYVFQHLLGGPRTRGELGRLLGVSQQAASKTAAELERLGYVEPAADVDARRRLVRLSARGLRAIEKARGVRAALEDKLVRDHGRARVAAARALLGGLLSSLGGADAVRTRRLRPPR